MSQERSLLDMQKKKKENKQTNKKQKKLRKQRLKFIRNHIQDKAYWERKVYVTLSSLPDNLGKGLHNNEFKDCDSCLKYIKVIGNC